jgi:hypothetical protein
MAMRTKTALYHLAMCLFWLLGLFIVDWIEPRYLVVFALGANVALFANEFKPKENLLDG